MAAYAQTAALVATQERLVGGRMWRMAADTGHRLSRAWVDLVLERMEVSLFSISMAGHAKSVDVGRAQQTFVIGRMHLVAVGTIFKSNLMPEFPFELATVVATQASGHAIFIHQI